MTAKAADRRHRVGAAPKARPVRPGASGWPGLPRKSSRRRRHDGVEEKPATLAQRSFDEGNQDMPLAKVHVLEGQYDKTRLGKMSEAIQNALIEVLGVPPDDFFQVHHVLPRDRYRHTPAFLGQEYSDDMILLEVTFITGRPKETRLALLKSLNEKIVAAVKISPADLVILLYEIAGENASFGSGLAQRTHIAAQS